MLVKSPLWMFEVFLLSDKEHNCPDEFGFFAYLVLFFCLVFKIIYYLPSTYFISSNYISPLLKIKREKTESELSDAGVSWLISG